MAAIHLKKQKKKKTKRKVPVKKTIILILSKNVFSKTSFAP